MTVQDITATLKILRGFFHLLRYPCSLKEQMILTDAKLARRALCFYMPDLFMTPLSSLPLFIGLLFLAHFFVPHEVSVQESGDVINQHPVCSCYISLRRENTG